MKKILSIILFLIHSTIQVNSEIITGGVTYTAQNAKEELLQNIPKTFDYKYIMENLYDPNFEQNSQYLLKGQNELNDRTIANFSDGSYGIIYKSRPNYVFYYFSNGSMTHYEIKESLEFPYKTYKYNLQRKLVNMTMRVSKDETYIFKPDGELIAHWLKEFCYDENNNIIMTRNIKGE